MTRFGIQSRAAILPLFLGLAFLLEAGIVATPVYAAKGDKEYKAGQKAEARQEYDEALIQYEQALKEDPNNPQFLIGAKRVRLQAGAVHVDRGHKLREQGNLREALAEYQLASAIDPSSPVARQGIALTLSLMEQQQAPASPAAPPQAPEGASAVPPATAPETPSDAPAAAQALGPAELQPLSRAPINLRMTNDSKIVLETIGKLAGINVLFDPDYVSKRITVELTNVTLEDALNQVALLTKTFWKPLTENTILIIPDSAVKRREQEQQIIKTFYLSNTITPQELTEVVTAIRTLLETRRIQQINSMNAIIIRDTPDKVAIAEKIIRDVDKARPEVVVDVAVLEVRRDKTRTLGLFPLSGTSGGIQIGAGFTPEIGVGGSDSAPGNAVRLNRLDNLSTGDWSITLPGATLNALLNDSQTKVLQRPEVRASDGQKATLRIGDRIPIATGSFQPGIGGVGVNPLVNTQFQYTDVGVNLDITPKVHTTREITMKVRVEISAVTSRVNIGGIEQPVIGQRVIEHDIRLREGEVNVLGGILQTQTVQSVTGIPGLSQIPVLRYLFSNTTNTLAEDEVLIVLRPHAVRMPDITPLNRRPIDVGTEGDIRLRTQRSSPEIEPGSETPDSGAAPPSAPAARLRFQHSPVAPQTGETFQVSVEIENAQEAFSVPLEVSYDAGTLKLIQVAKGDFLGQDSQPIAVVERTDEAGGKTAVTLSRPPGSGTVSGEGDLTVLTFQAMRPGSTTVAVTSSGIRGPSQEWLPLRGAEATLTVRQ